MVRDCFVFLRGAYLLSFSGRRVYYSWMIFLAALSWIGGYTFMRQFVDGLGVTSMSDQVPWGVYNANLTYLVGLAVSAVLLIIPVYVYRKKYMVDVALLAGLLAIAAIIMSLLFVAVDIGHPARLWHVIPFLGTPNFPSSMLAWDLVVLVGYLVVNVYICGYLLYMRYLGRRANFLLYGPFMAISVAWALSIHLVTVFLYAGLVGRPFWNAGIVAPRFLGSVFTAGPSILIISFLIIRRCFCYDISQKAIDTLRYIVTASLLLNLFLLACETFKEIYAAPGHSSSTRYLFLGLMHLGQYYGKLVPWIWLAIGMQVAAAAILSILPLARRDAFLSIACVLSIIGVWIEKGMGMVIAGFVPSPQGSVIEYSPSLTETLVSMGIWAFGLLLFSWMAHVAVPILTGEFAASRPQDSRAPEAATG